jgi:hypothetical protein
MSSQIVGGTSGGGGGGFIHHQNHPHAVSPSKPSFISSTSSSSSNFSSSSSPLPTHITDPYNFQEAMLVGVVAAGCFLYLNIMLHGKFNSKLNSDEYGQRIISFIHAVLSSVLCIAALFLHHGGWLDTTIATRLEGDVAMISFAYFFVDLVLMFVWKFDWMYFTHHVIALRWVSLTAIFGQIGFGGCVGIICAEICNPMMHGRWLLHASGKADSALCRWCTRIWFPVFFICRMIIIPTLLSLNYHVVPMDTNAIVTLFTIGSAKFLYDAVDAEMKGKWWEG